MMILDFLSLSCLASALLFLWFKTNAFIEYCNLFHINHPFYIKQYNEKYNEDFSLTYHFFLLKYHKSFITKLVTCPICVNVWLSTLLFLNNIKLIPITFILSLFIYKTMCKLFEE
jgi:hypothetical protein